MNKLLKIIERNIYYTMTAAISMLVVILNVIEHKFVYSFIYLILFIGSLLIIIRDEKRRHKNENNSRTE